MEVRVEHEPGRFVVRLDGAEATLVYERRGDLLDLQHTFTPPALRGREIAARLTEAAFAYARAQGLRIVPTCSYTRSYLSRPETLSRAGDGQRACGPLHGADAVPRPAKAGAADFPEGERAMVGDVCGRDA